MTFDEIVDVVADALNITSAAGITLIGTFVNKRYKRVTSAIGLEASRRTVSAVAFTLGVRRITVTDAQKVISVQDLTSSDPQPIFLDEISYEEMLELTPNTERPTKYAIESTTAHTVTILTDFNPQAAFTVYVEKEARASTLSGTNEPAFTEDFHDILEYGAKADMLRKLEKVQLARDAELDFERRLSELRLYLAVSAHQDIVQGKNNASVLQQSSGSGGGSSSVPSGVDSYTQTGLITFDRDPSYPFAVTSGSAKVDNLNADLLDGMDWSSIATDLLFTDALYDIGKSGLTRPRDLFLSRNAVVGGTLGVTGVPTFTAQAVMNGGATLAGHLIATDNLYDIGASGATRFRDLFLSRNAVIGGTLSLGGNIVSNLLFTDNTYDIGASGATRPRDLFLSRNATIGGTLGVTGISTFTGDVRTVAFTDYFASSTIVGWAASPSGNIWYKKIGKLVFVAFRIAGTSNAVSVTFTLPYTSATSGSASTFALGTTSDNSASVAAGSGSLPSASATVTCTTTAGGAWTAAGTKIVGGQFWYETA